ncbi:MAG: O-methyltransferase [Deltaproteobacteria bacterium]|nr:O-methyltransferase [Deltaproteobacteria bacterium]
MFTLTDPRIDDYLFKLASRYDEQVINEMEAYGRKNDFPIIDRLVGLLAHVFAHTLSAKRIFELGSGYGYSAFWFALAAGPSGKVWCTDGDPKNKKLAEGFLSRAGLWDRVEFAVGDAITSLGRTEGNFDIVYNDVDKDGYPAAWEAAKGRIRPGGLYICDNALWSGRVAGIKKKDVAPGWTEAIQKHNELVYADKNFDATLVPLRDGVLIAWKKG